MQQQLRDIDLDNKEMISYYSNSMRNVNNLKVIQMNHTKYQSYSYFSANQFSQSFQQLLRSSKLLFQFRENLFFTLRQMYLKRDSLLTILQWMSPPFNNASTRPADQILLKKFSALQTQGLLGALPQNIYIIEIERFLKVLQYDSKEMSLKILFELTSKMNCYVKDQKEYVFYDRFFDNLYRYFKPQENVTDLLNYQKEYEKKLKIEQQVVPQGGLRKIGVVTNDYKEIYSNLDGDFYDSIVNLLFAKGKVDYMNYVFMGFKIHFEDRFGINVLYGNPASKCKLYLRTITLSNQQILKRPQSAKNASKVQKIQPMRPQSAAVPPQKRIQSAKKQEGQKNYHPYSKTILSCQLSDCVQTFCEHQLYSYQLSETSITYNLIDLDDDYEFPSIRKKHYSLTSNFMSCLIAYSDSMFGVAKLMCDIHNDSDEEFEEEEFIEQPIYLEEPKKPEKPVWVNSVNQKKKKYSKKVVQEASSIIENDVPNNISDLAPVVKMLNTPNIPKKMEFNFAEYEVKITAQESDLHQSLSNEFEVDFSRFGFGSALVFQVYSVNSELVLGIKLSFPDENVELPFMKFPCIPYNNYDCHTWLIRPIDNIKGIQIQKKILNGEEFVRNLVLLVQDSEHSKLQEYEFDFVANVVEQNNQIPELTKDWREGQFSIYLNFDLKMLNHEEMDQVVVLLRKMNSIFESLFPQMIVIENMKKIKNSTVFEVFLQSMGRPSHRDHYDRYYLLQLGNWNKIKYDFEQSATELIDNLLILIWSYGGVKNLHQMEEEQSKRQTGRVMKNYAYKYISNVLK